MQDLVESYSTFTPLQLGIFTWNIDGIPTRDFEAASAVNQTLLHTFLSTLNESDLISFNFQEVGPSLCASRPLLLTHFIYS
jgi:hypothetical protein